MVQRRRAVTTAEKWGPLERNLWINENSHNAKEEEDGSDERIEGG